MWITIFPPPNSVPLFESSDSLTVLSLMISPEAISQILIRKRSIPPLRARNSLVRWVCSRFLGHPRHTIWRHQHALWRFLYMDGASRHHLPFQPHRLHPIRYDPDTQVWMEPGITTQRTREQLAAAVLNSVDYYALFSWTESSYETTTSFEPGESYWLFVTENVKILVTSDTPVNVTLHLARAIRQRTS